MSSATISVDTDDSRMSLIEHLTELRDRLIKIALAVVVGMVIAFFLYDWLFDFLLHPYRDVAQGNSLSLSQGDLLATDPLEGFGVRMKLAAYGGIFIAMPVILWQLWRFITPGLYAHEKRYAIPFMVSALTLFLLGAGIAYYTLPQALNFLQQIGGDNIVTAYSPSKYFKLITLHDAGLRRGLRVPDRARVRADDGDPHARHPAHGSGGTPSWASACSWPSSPRRATPSAWWRCRARWSSSTRSRS